jgi:hypothetical protein
MLHSRNRSTRSPKLQKAGLFDKQGEDVEFTSGEFRQSDDTDSPIDKRFRPEAFPNGSTGSGKWKFLQLAGK